MNNLKAFFKNLNAEYLRIEELRKALPHVLKFEKIVNFILCIVVSLLCLFGIALNSSAEETVPYDVEPVADYTLYGCYNFTTANLESVGDFKIEGMPFYTLNTLGLSGGYHYDGIWFISSSNTLAYHDVRDGQWKIANEDGYSEYDFYSFIYVTTKIVSPSNYNEFNKLYSYLFSGASHWERLTVCYQSGLNDGRLIYYDEGYNDGYEHGVNNANPFSNIIVSVFEGLDKFVIFADFSILDIIKAIMGIFLAVWLLKLIAGG